MRGSPVAVAAALAVALLAGAALGPAAASSPPRPACPACGALFEQAADESGVDVTIRESTVLVQVRENGSATWTIRNRLNATDGFREDPDALDATARQALQRDYGPPTDPTFRDARVGGDVAVVVLHDPDAAERHAGLLVVDYLHHGGDGTGIRLNADTIRIRGPLGTVVTNSPTGGVEDGRTVTWTGNAAGESFARGPYLEPSPYVAFGPESARGARTDAALALATLPIVVGALGQFVLLQTVMFAGILAAVVVGLWGWTGRRDPVAFGGGLAALGGTAAVTLALGHGWLSVPALAAVVGGLAATHPTVRARRWGPRRLAVGTVAALTAATVARLVLAPAVDAPRPVAGTAMSLALALPLAACLPLGAALDRSGRETAAWGTVAVTGFVVAALSVVNPVDPPTGLGGGVLAILLTVFAVVAPLVGAVVAAVGRALSGSSGTE